MLSTNDLKELFYSKTNRFDNDYINSSIANYFPFVKKYVNKEGRTVTKRYKIPYWSEKIDLAGNPSLDIAYRAAIGRPFIFKAKEMLTKDEYKDFENPEIEDDEELPFN